MRQNNWIAQDEFRLTIKVNHGQRLWSWWRHFLPQLTGGAITQLNPGREANISNHKTTMQYHNFSVKISASCVAHMWPTKPAATVKVCFSHNALDFLNKLLLIWFTSCQCWNEFLLFTILFIHFFPLRLLVVFCYFFFSLFISYLSFQYLLTLMLIFSLGNISFYSV